MERTLGLFNRGGLPLLSAAAVFVLTVAPTAPARAAMLTITFDEGTVAAGATLANQYSSIGATFVTGLGGATGVTNPVATTQGFATNTDMTIVSSTGSDVGGGLAAPISGLMLHSFNGWLSEDGDAVFRINFSTPITFFSADFGGVADIASSGIFAINGSNAAIQSAFTLATGTSTVSLTLTTPVSSIVITQGDYNDWVGIDNIRFTTVAAVPEPATNVALAIGALGLMAAGWVRRRQGAIAG